MGYITEIAAHPYVRVGVSAAMVLSVWKGVHEVRQHIADPLGQYSHYSAGVSPESKVTPYELPEFNKASDAEQVGTSRCRPKVYVTKDGLPVKLEQPGINGEEISVSARNENGGTVFVDYRIYEQRQGVRSEASRWTVMGAMPSNDKLQIGTRTRSTCVKITG